jgi:hypothetical protein
VFATHKGYVVPICWRQQDLEYSISIWDDGRLCFIEYNTNEESFQFDRGITNMAESWSEIMDKKIRHWPKFLSIIKVKNMEVASGRL